MSDKAEYIIETFDRLNNQLEKVKSTEEVKLASKKHPKKILLFLKTHQNVTFKKIRKSTLIPNSTLHKYLIKLQELDLISKTDDWPARFSLTSSGENLFIFDPDLIEITNQLKNRIDSFLEK